ncbi:MAG TPA: NUDIX hydrolase [Acidimicrobiales bacterium]|nr:NUDIX hydrolase [Acidimicrobiales bacterium]
MDGTGGDEGPAFRQLGERERYDGSFLRLVTATIVGPDGFTFERDIVRHCGAVCVVPLEADRQHALLVRQYRASVGQSLLELPAGKLDVADEPPEECAQRELIEEVGRDAGRITRLGWFYNSPGFTDEKTYCYLAEDLIDAESSAQGVEEHHMTVERIALSDFEELRAAGELVDGKTIVGLTLAIAHLQRAGAGG